MKEEIKNTVGEETAKTLFQLALGIVKKIGQKTIDAVKIQNAINKYAENYVSRHGKIKVLGMPESVFLEDIYTKVNLIKADYLYKEKEINYLERTFRENRGDYGITDRKEGIDIANEKKRLNVLGAPGSGKSTFLKRIGMQALKLEQSNKLFNNNDEFYIPDCIPVLVELKRFRNEDVNLKAIIQKEFEIAGFPESNMFIDSALNNGNLLILLDGLDEVPSRILDRVIEHIRDFSDQYKNNRFITSCRTAFYKTYLVDFTDVEIASFDNTQIEKFIENWFSFGKDIQVNTSTRFLKQLFSNDNRSSLELARTPLLLVFLCLTFDESQKFPANRSSLYRRALMILLERWAAEKRIHNEDIYQDFSSDLEIEMLAEIAAKFYTQDKIFFFENELNQQVKIFFESTLNIKNIPISKIIEAIEIQQGLLVQRAPEIYSFSHLTIQEYLTAHYYFSPQKTIELVKKNIFDKRWREVFLLLAGMSTADDLLKLMVTTLKEYIKTDKILSETIAWLNDWIPETEDFEADVAKRVFFATLVLKYKRYDSSGFKKPDNIESGALFLMRTLNPPFPKSMEFKEHLNRKDAIRIIELACEWRGLDSNTEELKSQIMSMAPSIPQSGMLNGGRHKFKREILNKVYDFLKTPENIRNARKPAYKALQNYIDGYVLVLACKNASLRISKDVWKETCLSVLKN